MPPLRATVDRRHGFATDGSGIGLCLSPGDYDNGFRPRIPCRGPLEAVRSSPQTESHPGRKKVLMSASTPRFSGTVSGSAKTTRSVRGPFAELIARLWSHVLAGIALAAVLAVVAGLLAAELMPRGPITSTQAIELMLLGLVTGAVSGFAMRSRWAMVVASLLFVAAFEFGRRGTDGPTVDGIVLDNTFGVLALIVGRGPLALFGLFSIIMGVLYGTALARRLSPNQNGIDHRGAGFYLRRGGAALATVALVGLAILVLLPASTPPVRGENGQPLPGGISELTRVTLGGHEQSITIRGASPDLPVMLWLAGGPGQTDLPYTRLFFDELAQDVIIVNWDQRGAGKSYPALDPTSTWTLEQAIADTAELTNYLRDRFDEEKIYLAGESWGTTLGVMTVQQHPDLFYAWIGSGQMVDQLETDRMIYQGLQTYAEQEGDSSLAAELEAMGPPPYPTVFDYGYILTQYDKLIPDYDPPAAYEAIGNNTGVGPFGILAEEYTFIERFSVLRGLMDMFAVMYPQLQEVNFRVDVPNLAVPIYLFQGEYELEARDDLAREWFGMVDAPAKTLYTIENAGHSTVLEGFETFHQVMVEVILPATYPTAS